MRKSVIIVGENAMREPVRLCYTNNGNVAVVGDDSIHWNRPVICNRGKESRGMMELAKRDGDGCTFRLTEA